MSLAQHPCYIVRGRALGIYQGEASHIAALWRCMWGRGPRGNSAACSALCWFSVTSLATHKQIGPFLCWFPGGCVCVHSRILWVSPMNFCEAGSFSCHCNPYRFLQPEILRLYFPHWNPGLCILSHSSVVPPGLSAHECGTASHRLTHPVLHPLPCRVSSPPLLPASAPPTGLDECFFFNSLVVTLQFDFSVTLGCFLFLNLLPFSLCKEAKCIYLYLFLG